MLWIKRIVFVFALAPLVMCQAADEAFKAGEHYDILPQVVRTANERLKRVSITIFCLRQCELLIQRKLRSMKFFRTPVDIVLIFRLIFTLG